MMENAANNDLAGQLAQSPTTPAGWADRELRLQALQLAVSAHSAGDCKRDVADKATAFIAFLKTGAFPTP